MEKNLGEIISPEGVEERLKSHLSFSITLTGGGKYRVYVERNGERSTVAITNTWKEAEEAVTFAVIGTACFMNYPKAMLETVLQKLREKK